MKKIVAKSALILSVVFVVISICGISSVACLKGIIPIQDTIIYHRTIIQGLQYGDISNLPYKQIPLFYFSLVLTVLSSIFNFARIDKVKSIIILGFTIIPNIYVLITHNYIWFLMFFNIYLLLYVLLDCPVKSKFSITTFVLSLLIFIFNIIKLVEHLLLQFNSSNMQEFESTLIDISSINTLLLSMWIVPYIILLIKAIITSFKSSKH